MTQRAANTSPLVIGTTFMYVVVTAACLIGGVRTFVMLAIGLLLALVGGVCYLTAPTHYELSQGNLTVFTHLGSRNFGPIVRCSPVPASIIWSIGVFRNGGVFAITGLYWHWKCGWFRAYVTNPRRSKFVL